MCVSLTVRIKLHTSRSSKSPLSYCERGEKKKRKNVHFDTFRSPLSFTVRKNCTREARERKKKEKKGKKEGGKKGNKEKDFVLVTTRTMKGFAQSLKYTLSMFLLSGIENEDLLNTRLSTRSGVEYQEARPQGIHWV